MRLLFYGNQCIFIYLLVWFGQQLEAEAMNLYMEKPSFRFVFSKGRQSWEMKWSSLHSNNPANFENYRLMLISLPLRKEGKTSVSLRWIQEFRASIAQKDFVRPESLVGFSTKWLRLRIINSYWEDWAIQQFHCWISDGWVGDCQDVGRWWWQEAPDDASQNCWEMGETDDRPVSVQDLVWDKTSVTPRGLDWPWWGCSEWLRLVDNQGLSDIGNHSLVSDLARWPRRSDHYRHAMV